MKRCAACKQLLPATAEYFVKNRAEKSGLHNYCKNCWRDQMRSKRAERRAPTVPIPPNTRVCGVCITLKPATREYFAPNKAGKGGLQSFCKKCAAKLQREYRQKYPERTKDTETKRDKGKLRARARERYLKVGKEARRLYVKRHPERVRASSQNQRAKRKSVVGAYTGQDLLLLFKGQAGKCWWCGCKIKGKFEVDHRIPLSRGGTNDAGNIVISCVKCNRSKHDKLPYEWIGRLL